MLAIPLIRTDDETRLTPIERTTIACEQVITALMMQATLGNGKRPRQTVTKDGKEHTAMHRCSSSNRLTRSTCASRSVTCNSYVLLEVWRSHRWVVVEAH